MKIIQIVRDFNSGGAERFVVDLTNQLYTMGHDVSVVRFSDKKSNNFFEKDLNSNIKIKTLKRTLKFDFVLPFKILWYLLKERADVINLHMGDSFSFSILAFLCIRRSSFYYTFHNMHFKSRKVTLVLQRLVFKLELVTPIAIADEVRVKAMEVFKINDISTIYNGRALPVLSPSFSSSKEYIASLREAPFTKIVLSVGRVIKVKNHELLIKVVDELNMQGHKLKLLIIGDCSASVSLVSKYSENNNVVFLGKRDNIADFLHLCDIFSLSSLSEGMPISLIEAFSMGCVSVCTPAGGISSMISDGYNGFLATGFSIQDMIHAFERCLTHNPEGISTISENARRTFSTRFGIQKCAEEYVQLYSRS